MDEKKSLRDEVAGIVKSEKTWLFKLGMITVIVVIFYFVASPYQNCLRDGVIPSYCATVAKW